MDRREFLSATAVIGLTSRTLADPQYTGNVSAITDIILRPMPYSQI